MALAVLIHGYGSSAAEIRRELDDLGGLDGLDLIAWDAPDRCDLFPDKRQWFQLSALDAFLSRAVAAAAEALAERIGRIERGDGPIYLLGHSQGGMIAAFLALSGRLPGSRAICVSASLPFLGAIPVDPAADVTFVHGDDDQFVPVERLVGQIGSSWPLVRLPRVGHKFEGELARAARDALAERRRRDLEPGQPGGSGPS